MKGRVQDNQFLYLRKKLRRTDKSKQHYFSWNKLKCNVTGMEIREPDYVKVKHGFTSE